MDKRASDSSHNMAELIAVLCLALLMAGIACRGDEPAMTVHPTFAPPSQGELLSVDEAKARGLEEARFAGLIGEPTDEFAELTTLDEYVGTPSYGTGELGADSSDVGLNPDKKIWVVAFRGHVQLSLPGGDGKFYDNITLALDAETGEIVGVNAYPEGHTPPYR